MTKFSLVGKALKVDDYDEMKRHLRDITDETTEVYFGGNTFGIDACKAIADAIRDKQNITKVSFDDIFTGRLKDEIPKSMEHITEAVLTLKNATTVDFSDNAFGITTVDPLADFLGKHVPLQHLHLTNNGFGPAAGTKIGEALERLAEAKKEAKSDIKLETVICGRNRLENGSMESWAKYLATHGSVKNLQLKQNGIRQDGIVTLLEKGLAKCPALEILDLQDNTFTKKGAKALAKVYAEWPELIELGISDCLLSGKGSIFLGEALRDGKPLEKLEILRLQYNEINLDGAEALYEALEKNLPAIKVLELNGNCFPEDEDVIDKITKLFDSRGHGELDELDEMEEPDSDEEDEDESEDEAEEENDKAEKKDEAVDDLADELEKKANIE
ncbi:Ran GTPase-activating protein 1 [Yarrowia sp. B02]|nr:Ran GTPase-activating protein 1 [Yarrowia sp. B02]